MLLEPEERRVSHGEVIGKGKGKETAGGFGAQILTRQDNSRKANVDACQSINYPPFRIDRHYNVDQPSSSSRQSLANEEIGYVRYSGDVAEGGDKSWVGYSGGSQFGQNDIQGLPERYEVVNISHGSGGTASIRSPLDHIKGVQSGRVVFSSSSTSVQHPVPQSAPQSEKISRLLRYNSSDIAESTKVSVGTQVLDNEIWQSWAVKEEAPALVRKYHISIF
jgi:hypothetical protein